MKQRCDFCKVVPEEEDGTIIEVIETRDERLICPKCAQWHNLCETCGSLPTHGNIRDQLHYEDECFK